MKRLPVLTVCFLLITTSLAAQNTSWFYGSWTGETYFPNGPITKRIIVKLLVTSVSGNSFLATLSNFYPNDTTIRLQRIIRGSLAKKALTITGNQQTYIRDPRTQNFWQDCSGCPLQSSFSINSSQVVIKLTTTGCGDVCNGETTFSRDTSDLNSTQKIQLATWLGLPANKPVANTTTNKPDNLIAKKLPVDSLKASSNKPRKPPATDTITAIPQSPKKDTAASVRKVVKKETSLTTKKDTLPPPVLPVPDTARNELTARTTNLVNTFRATSPHITVQLFDNAEIDGDMVSVYHNGKLIVDHQTLTHKAITITLTASKADSHHEFIMIADNVGLTPPNTALLRITAGAQKFELELSSDYDNNAKIVIDYTGE